MKKSKTSSYVLTLPLNTTVSDNSALEKYFELSRMMYNAILGETLRRLKLMRESKKYQLAIKTKNDEIKKRLFKECEKMYGFREFDLSNEYTTKLRVNEYKELGSHVTQKLAFRAFKTVKKLIFGNAKKVNFVRYGEMSSIEGSDNKQGIKYRNGYVIFNKLKMPVIIKKKDIYAHLALHDRIKYCRLIRKNIKCKIKYYIQLVLEGIPPKKYNVETGEIKHVKNKGDVGIDIGTQTIAICSNKDVKLLELAPNVNDIYKQKRILQRKMDRQKRANNPQKYNVDSTLNKNNMKWHWSKNYLKTKNKLANIERVIAEIRKQDHNTMANFVLTLGDDIKVEDMDYSRLKARTKETTTNKKTNKINSKRRFGKSIANKAPSLFLTILDNKLKYDGKYLKKINTYSVKASQYNHISNNFIKKKLSERWNDFGDFKIQRDLYSAFLIMNVKENLNQIDREKCINEFDTFKCLHDTEIERIKKYTNKLICSMGI